MSRDLERHLANDTDDGEWDDDVDEWDDEPNYLVRRLVLIAVVLVGLVVAVVAATQLLGGDDGSNASGANTQWDTVVVLTDDEIRVLDRDGLDELSAIDVAPGLLDAQAVTAGNTLVTMTDEGRITLFDLTDGTERRGRAGLDESLRASSGNPAIMVVAPDAGGDVTSGDTLRSEIFSISDVAGLDAPLIFADQVLVNPAGTHVAVPVPNAFQSFVIDLELETAEAYAGRVIALDDTRVVTEQPAGDESEIEFHELAGDRLGTVDVPSPVATMLVPGESLVLVSDDGTVRLADDGGDLSDAPPLADAEGRAVIASSGVGVFGGTRLLVATSNGVIVLDQDGEPVTSTPGSVLTPVSLATRCVPVGSGSSSTGFVLIDVDAGDVAAEVERGLATAASSDGCVVAVSAAGSPVLVVDADSAEIDANSIEAIAPDGEAYVVLDGRDSEFFEVGADDPVDLADDPAVIRFGRRE